MKFKELKKEKETLIAKCGIANSFFSRFMGLMGKTSMKKNEALCFPKCNSIHTFFMRIPIDVLFLTKTGKVIEVQKSLSPWRMLLPRSKAKHVVEMKANLASELGIKVGTQLKLEGVF